MSSDQLKWHASCRVEKFSAGQVALFHDAVGDGYKPTAALLKRLVGDPFETVDVDGNLLVTLGLSNIISLLAGSGGKALTATQGICGVGSVSNPATIADTALGGDGSSASAYYQGLDAAPSVTGGQISVVSTFGDTVANFDWNEWCWAVCTAPVVPGYDLSTAGSGVVLLNHKVSSMGVKPSGQAWALNTSVTLS
jgi:hypothetical protein